MTYMGRLMARLFFALDIHPTDQEQLFLWRQQYLSLPFKAITPTNFHITLCFIGSVEEQKVLQMCNAADQLCNAHQLSYPANLNLDSCGWFAKAKVIYLSSTQVPKWLSHLAYGLNETACSLGIFQESRPYIPHISIYRKAKFNPPQPQHQAPSITIKSFSLYRSSSLRNEIHYQAIKKWYLYDN